MGMFLSIPLFLFSATSVPIYLHHCLLKLHEMWWALLIIKESMCQCACLCGVHHEHRLLQDTLLRIQPHCLSVYRTLESFLIRHCLSYFVSLSENKSSRFSLHIEEDNTKLQAHLETCWTSRMPVLFSTSSKSIEKFPIWNFPTSWQN